ncbi:MAG: DUF560 domain-containing protein [Methylococcaceae bacterium]|nr:MAG: DUF560 domain-containing protein [Methylococcaceae bacterium]
MIRRSWSKTVLAILVFAGQLLCPPVFAETQTPRLDEAQRLLQAGQAEQALTLLERDWQGYAGQADFDYLLGTALLQTGRSEPALFAFERVLIVAPDHLDARLQSALIYAERSDAPAVDKLLQPLANQPLGAARQAWLDKIRAVFAAKPALEPLVWQGHLLAGLGWDSNVTSGPGLGILALTNSSSSVAVGKARQDDDGVAQLAAGLTLRKQIGDDTWLAGNANVRQGFNYQRNDVNVGYGNLDVGVIRRAGQDYYGASLLTQGFRFGDAFYRRSLGGRLNWVHPFSDQTRLNGYFQYIDLDYPVYSANNAARKIGGVSREHPATPERAWSFQYGVYGGAEDMKNMAYNGYSYDVWGLNLAAGLPVNADLAFSVAGLFEARHYLGRDSLYFIHRQEQQYSLVALADYRLADNWHVMPQYNYIRNVSNTALWDYERHAFMLQLRWEFANEKR